MTQNTFPLIASGIGLVLILVLVRSVTGDAGDEPLLPALTLLFISEFGFLVTIAGAWVGGRAWLMERNQHGILLAALACLALALAFLYLGLSLWGGVAPA